MGKGKGSGPGRPRKEVPSGAVIYQRLVGTKDQAQTIKQLAAEFGVSTSTLQRRMKEATPLTSKAPTCSNKARGSNNPAASPMTVRILPDNGGTVTVPAPPAELLPYEAIAEAFAQLPPEVPPEVPPETPPEAPPATPEPVPAESVQGDEDEEAEGNMLLFEGDYTYNQQTDTYITFVDSAPKPILMPGSKHRAMLEAYSNWDGQPASINEICRTFDIPRQWFIEYKKAHGWTHDLEPVTHEELCDKSMDDLVEKSLQLKRQAFFRKFSKRDWQQTQSAAEKWWDFEQSVLVPLREHIEHHAPQYTVPLLPMAKAISPFAVVLPAFDLHYGKGAWRDETGESYSRAECRTLLMHHTAAVAAKITRFGRPERLIVPVGSDWMHIDNQWNETVNGTRQDTDGSHAQILIEGSELAVEYLDLLRQIAPIEMIYVDGNHDRASSLSMALYVKAWFRHMEQDVHCTVVPTPRQYAEYGTTLLGFCHGDDVRVADLPALMASEAREAWGRTRDRAFFTGHLHHEAMRDLGGIQHYQVASLSGVDRWHKRKGFCLSKRALTAYVIDRATGAIDTLTSPVQHELVSGIKMPGNSFLAAA